MPSCFRRCLRSTCTRTAECGCVLPLSQRYIQSVVMVPILPVCSDRTLDASETLRSSMGEQLRETFATPAAGSGVSWIHAVGDRHLRPRPQRERTCTWRQLMPSSKISIHLGPEKSPLYYCIKAKDNVNHENHDKSQKAAQGRRNEST